MNKKIKCRVCKKTDVHFSPSRIKKKDYICTVCNNIKRREYVAKTRLSELEIYNLKKYNNYEGLITAQVKHLHSLQNAPTCPFCNNKLKPNRNSMDKGKALNWTCNHCNDYIIGRNI